LWKAKKAMLNFSEFSSTSFDEWIEKIKTDLKGKELKSLKKDSLEGVRQMPFSAPLPEIPGNDEALDMHPKNTWDCIEVIADKDGKVANKHALHALMNGADGLHFVFQENWDWADVIKGINFEYISVYLDNSIHQPSFNKLKWNNSPNTYWISANFEETGKACTNKIVKSVNQGAMVDTELAIALNELKKIIEQLLAKGMNEDEASAHVFAAMASCSNHLIEVAKIRAIKYMYAFMLEKMGVEHDCSKFLHVYSIPQAANKFSKDVENNLLRLSSEFMSTLLGGSDAIGILPYNLNKEEGSILSQDISRNISNLLREESYLDKCADPTKGAYYFEELSAKIISKSWSKFQKLEACVTEIEKNALIEKWLQKDATQRKANYESKSKKFIGANIFPSNDNETSFEASNYGYLSENNIYALNEVNHG
jgi:methylmalonyl-CoA mutase